jgi:hypothetical protein
VGAVIFLALFFVLLKFVRANRRQKPSVDDSHYPKLENEGSGYTKPNPTTAELPVGTVAPSGGFHRDPVPMQSTRPAKGPPSSFAELLDRGSSTVVIPTGTSSSLAELPDRGSSTVVVPTDPSVSEKEVIPYSPTSEKEVVAVDKTSQSDRSYDPPTPGSSREADLAHLRAEQAKIAERKSRLLQLNALEEEEEAIRRQIASISGS